MAKIAHVAANISRVAADISRVEAEKAVEGANSCWPKKFFFNFSKFFGIFNGEITFYFKKCSKNGLISEKILIFEKRLDFSKKDLIFPKKKTLLFKNKLDFSKKKLEFSKKKLDFFKKSDP